MNNRRRTPRLPSYDYTTPSAYFVTIVTVGREMLFEDATLRAAAERNWRWLSERYPYVPRDELIVMPNHLHAILIIDDVPVGTPKPLGGLIGAFKTVSTQEINRLRCISGTQVWQRGFYEHVIRDEAELNRIRGYIIDNPRRWNEDPHNPGVAPSVDGSLAGPFPNGPYGYEGVLR